MDMKRANTAVEKAKDVGKLDAMRKRMLREAVKGTRSVMVNPYDVLALLVVLEDITKRLQQCTDRAVESVVELDESDNPHGALGQG